MTALAALAQAAPAAPAAEPTAAGCRAALADAETSTRGLPADGVARRFAETDLAQARAEAGNGEYDDCLEWAEKAADEARHPHHDGAPVAAPEPALPR